jgi:protein phosphatase 2C family protein 2/3
MVNCFQLFFPFTACPDINECDVTPDLEFLVLACDGIWDVLTNQEVIDFVRMRVANKMEPEIVGGNFIV